MHNCQFEFFEKFFEKSLDQNWTWPKVNMVQNLTCLSGNINNAYSYNTHIQEYTYTHTSYLFSLSNQTSVRRWCERETKLEGIIAPFISERADTVHQTQLSRIQAHPLCIGRSEHTNVRSKSALLHTQPTQQNGDQFLISTFDCVLHWRRVV